MEATEKYSGQVKLVELPDGALTLSGYQGGMPFPNPAEPHQDGRCWPTFGIATCRI
jgi:hypothetical protein